MDQFYLALCSAGAVLLALFHTVKLHKAWKIHLALQNGSPVFGAVKETKRLRKGGFSYLVDFYLDGTIHTQKALNPSHKGPLLPGDGIDLYYYQGKVVLAKQGDPGMATQMIAAIASMALYAFTAWKLSGFFIH